MTDGWTVEAKQLKNRRAAETKWAVAVAERPNFLRTASRKLAPRPANPVMEEPIRIGPKLGEQQANVIERGRGDFADQTSQNSISPVWTNHDLPPYPVGMELLRQFEETGPTDYAFLQMLDFADLSTAGFAGIPEWDACAEHCGICEDCKE